MEFISTIPNFTIRLATTSDCTQILKFLNYISDHFQHSFSDNITTETIRETFFVRNYADIVLGEHNNEPIAFAILYKGFSSTMCKQIMILEELFVCEKYRKQGVGNEMLRYISMLTVSINCARLDWTCYKFNLDALSFYNGIGAQQLQDIVCYRMQADDLAKVAANMH